MSNRTRDTGERPRDSGVDLEVDLDFDLEVCLEVDLEAGVEVGSDGGSTVKASSTLILFPHFLISASVNPASVPSMWITAWCWTSLSIRPGLAVPWLL